MNRRKKAGNTKPQALTKPPAPNSATTPAPAPAPPPAIPTRVSPPPRATAPSQNVTPPKPPPAQKVAQQPPKLSASPPKHPVPSMPTTTKNLASKPGPPQRSVLTPSDRVRAIWAQFDQSWVRPQQAVVEQRLHHILSKTEQECRVKAIPFEPRKQMIVSSERRPFAMAARAEWERRLEGEGLRAEDWVDMTAEDMAAVESVLSCDDVVDEPTGPANPLPLERAAPIGAARAHMDVPHPIASHPVTSRTGQAPPPVPSQKLSQPQPPPSVPKGKQSAWTTWAADARHITVTEVPDEPAKMNSGWGTRPNAPIIEDVRVSPKPVSVHQTPQASQSVPRPAQPGVQAELNTASVAPTHGLLAYPVPISLTMAPLDSAAASDSDFTHLIDNAYYNSIKDFHTQAAEVDAALACELRKPLSSKEREWTIRAHQVSMEQMARTIVSHRDAIIERERRKRGYGGDGGAPPPPPPSVPKYQSVSSQPPGAFPDDGIHVSAIEPEEDVEIEREPEPDVDEVIEIPLKGKAGKKKGKKAMSNGRSTPTPAAPAPSPAKPVAAVSKPTSVVEKPVPVAAKKPGSSAWNAKVAPALRSASPAPAAAPTPLAPIINTPVPNGRSTPVPLGMSPWEYARAKAAGTLPAAPAESQMQPQPHPPSQAKPPSPPNGMWAPSVNRSSSKNPYAPTRPSRLAQVTEPESSEPPSPPPVAEPTGKDYVAWFAGSSSEDENEGSEDAGLSEDGYADEDSDDHATAARGAGMGAGAQAGPSGFGGILGALAGGSPWALFGGESSQPQPQERGRSAVPDRGRGVAATPAPAVPAAGRRGPEMGMGAATGMSSWNSWGAPAASSGHGNYATGPSGFSFGGAGLDAGASGFGGPGVFEAGFARGPGASAGGRQWPRKEEDGLEDVLELASRSLDRAGGQASALEEAMAMYVTAQKARDTLATPVGGRSANPWGRR